MAFYEFARRKVDCAVIETGMGGRMDATDVVSPTVSIITNISLEHKTYLGDTIAAITRKSRHHQTRRTGGHQHNPETR